MNLFFYVFTQQDKTVVSITWKEGEQTNYGKYEGGKDRRKLIRSRLAEIQKQRVELQKQKRQRLQESER